MVVGERTWWFMYERLQNAGMGQRLSASDDAKFVWWAQNFTTVSKWAQVADGVCTLIILYFFELLLKNC